MAHITLYPPKLYNDVAQTTVISFELNGSRSIYKLYDCERAREVNCEYVPSGKFILTTANNVFEHTLKVIETGENGQFLGDSNEFIVGKRDVQQVSWKDIYVIRPEEILISN